MVFDEGTWEGRKERHEGEGARGSFSSPRKTELLNSPSPSQLHTHTQPSGVAQPGGVASFDHSEPLACALTSNLHTTRPD